MDKNCTVAAIEIRKYKADTVPTKGFRVYNSAPGEVTLQIRGTIVNTPCIAMAYVNKEQLLELKKLIAEAIAEL